MYDKDKVRPQTPPGHVPWGSVGQTGICSENNSVLAAYDCIEASNVGQVLTGLRSSRRNARVLDGSITYASKETTKFDDIAIKKDDAGLSERVATSQRPRRVGEEVALTLHEKQDSPQFSFHQKAPKRHSNLAIRRGHKALPLLKLNRATNKRKRKDTVSSDSIPVAFRGSPTVYCSPIWPHAQNSTSQNLALAEMLEHLREKCASFSSRVSLPPDWFYRPRSQAKDLTKLSDTATSQSQSDEDEWAFAEPFLDMINSFSASADNLGTHPIAVKDDIPTLSRMPLDIASFQACSSSVEHDKTKEFPFVSAPPARYLPVRPSLISPTSLRTTGRGAKKKVRFANLPISSSSKATAVSLDGCTTLSSSKVSLHKRQNVVLSTWIPPTPPLSDVRSSQSAKPSQGSWSDTLPSNILRSPPLPRRRPLSHRYPTSPKLPSFIDSNTTARTLSGEPLRQSSASKPRPDLDGKLPPVHSPVKKQLLLMKGRKTQGIKENLKISHPIPIAAAPRKKQRPGTEGLTDSSGSQSHVNSPLRSIFMKWK